MRITAGYQNATCTELIRTLADESYFPAARARARASSDGELYSNVSSEPPADSRRPSISYGADGTVSMSWAVRLPSCPLISIPPSGGSRTVTPSSFIASSASFSPVRSAFKLTLKDSSCASICSSLRAAEAATGSCSGVELSMSIRESSMGRSSSGTRRKASSAAIVSGFHSACKRLKRRRSSFVFPGAIRYSRCTSFLASSPSVCAAEARSPSACAPGCESSKRVAGGGACVIRSSTTSLPTEKRAACPSAVCASSRAMFEVRTITSSCSPPPSGASCSSMSITC